MVITSQISHNYKGTQIFNFPDIKCNPQNTLLILGQSGVGKTTLLHILGGILKPQKGTVSINDQNLYQLSGNSLDSFRGQNIGIVFQKPHFVQAISAEENLFLAQKMSGNHVNKERVNALLQQLNLGKVAQSKTYNMSQGELQRLSIARALINNPAVVLADEPTSALDDKNCEEVIKLLENQSQALNSALIIVTHDNRLKKYFQHHLELN